MQTPNHIPENIQQAVAIIAAAIKRITEQKQATAPPIIVRQTTGLQRAPSLN